MNVQRPTAALERGFLVCVGLVCIQAAALVMSAHSASPTQDRSSAPGVLEVVVHVSDPDGQPLAGLTPEDFTVLVDGTLRPVDTLTEVEPWNPQGAPFPFVSPDRDVAATREPDVASRLVAVVIDEGVLYRDGTGLFRLGTLVDALIAETSAGDELSFATGIRAVPFTMSPFAATEAGQRAAVQRLLGRLTAGVVVPEDPAVGFRNAHSAIRSIVRAIGDARALDPMLILVTDGLDQLSYEPVASGYRRDVWDRQRTAEFARMSGVPIQVVDVRPRPSVSASSAVDEERAALADLAQRTGGRLVVAESDLGETARTVLGPTGRTYVLKVHRGEAAGDATDVDVGLRGREGTVRTPLARVVGDGLAPSFRGDQAGAAVNRALTFGIPHRAIQLRAGIVAVGRTAEQVNTILVIEARGLDVALQEAEIDVYLMTFDHTDIQLGVTQFTPGGETRTSASGEWTWHGGVRVPNETRRVGVAVLERHSGTLGAVQLVFEPPSSRLSAFIGGVLVGSPVEQSLDVAGRLPLVPTLDRVFESQDSITGLVPVFWRSPDVGTATLTATIKTDKGEAVAAETRTVGGPVAADGMSRWAHVLLPLNLKDLAPGDYRLSLRAWSEAGGEPATRTIAFAVR